ncbi:MAG: FKBP-type peptidyl-prolyl cis-trans isomerase [Pseudomonadota bacterium]
MTLRAAKYLVLGTAIGLLAACSAEAPADPETPAASAETSSAEGETAMGPGAVIDEYLPWDATDERVQITASGLQYIVLKEGPAEGAMPTDRDRVTVFYEGRVADSGEKFDSSYDRGSPATFPVGGVIRGWIEGLQLMSEGDEYLFYIPNDLAYGQQARGPVIKAGDDLVFKVDLQEVVPAPAPREISTEVWDTYTPWDPSRDGIQTTESGLQYYVIASGDPEKAMPTGSDRVVVYYEGRLDASGDVFDSAYRRGEAAIFPADGLIPGWVEALQLMRPGDRWLVHIPSELGYGARGTPGGEIPPGSDLNFEVELMDVLPVQ